MLVFAYILLTIHKSYCHCMYSASNQACDQGTDMVVCWLGLLVLLIAGHSASSYAMLLHHWFPHENLQQALHLRVEIAFFGHSVAQESQSGFLWHCACSLTLICLHVLLGMERNVQFLCLSCLAKLILVQLPKVCMQVKWRGGK